ncbi:MAG: Glutamyl-tRNA reductase, partial [Akkermansiaceae bacterium]|nr:Glutamyl-tRNA reductase [Akkermansiaceae bacterium]
MELVCIGLNHRTAPVEVLERFSVPTGKLGESSRHLLEI